MLAHCDKSMLPSKRLQWEKEATPIDFGEPPSDNETRFVHPPNPPTIRWMFPRNVAVSSAGRPEHKLLLMAVMPVPTSSVRNLLHPWNGNPFVPIPVTPSPMLTFTKLLHPASREAGKIKSVPSIRALASPWQFRNAPPPSFWMEGGSSTAESPEHCSNASSPMSVRQLEKSSVESPVHL